MALRGLLQALIASVGLHPRDLRTSQRPPSHCHHAKSVGTDVQTLAPTSLLPFPGQGGQSFLVGGPALSLGLELLSAQVPCPTLPPAMSTHPGAPHLHCWAAGLPEGAGSFSTPTESMPLCTVGLCSD